MDKFISVPRNEILDLYGECLNRAVKGKDGISPTDFFKGVTYWRNGPFAVDPLGRQMGVIVDNV